MEALYKRFGKQIEYYESNCIECNMQELLREQNIFSKDSQYTKESIYIIKDCEKMNKQASNSILKFLEEPVEGIIAILVTSNISKVLETISSRCQIINLKKQSNYSELVDYEDREVVSLFINDEDNNNINVTFYFYYKFLEFLKFVINFFNDVEEIGYDVIIDMKNRWYDKIQNREEFDTALILMLCFYYDVLKVKVGIKDYTFYNYKKMIDSYVSKFSIDVILKKIDIISYGIEAARYNLNINLLSDDIVIRLGECNEYS